MDLFSLEAEKAILGALLTADVMQAVESEIEATDFSEKRNQDIYSVCKELFTEGNPIDPVMVKSRLQERGEFLNAGGMGYLITMADNTPEVDRVSHYAKIVKRFSGFRQIQGWLEQQAALIHSSTANESMDEIFSRLHTTLDAIKPDTEDTALLMWLDSFAQFVLEQDRRKEELQLIAEGKMTDRATLPWRNLKYFGLDYIRPEMFMVVAADSSVGKTTFLENIAEHNAERGLNVVFFHLELSHQTMMDRRAVRWSGEKMEVVDSGVMTPAMEDANRKLQTWKGGVHYVHCPNWSIRRIVNYARMLRRKGKCDLVIIDYLQKINLFYRRGWTEENALADVGEVIKNSAEQLGMPYILGSQMNRASRQEKRRTMNGVRGSGQISEKSNVGITLDRDILDENFVTPEGIVAAVEGERSPVTSVRIDKNTMGKTGDTKLWMTGARFKFSDVDVVSLDEWMNADSEV